jgi:phenylacetate-CoA ligase
VYSPNVFLEIVDDANASCPPGQTGHILVTLLNNPGFPLVRYRIGDLGRWAPPAACPCGLSWPRIQDLQGRADDMLITEEGAPLSSTFIRHTVGVSLNRELIREWQVDQVGPRTVVFRYRPMSADGLAANLEELANRFRLVLGGTVEIRPEQVDDIPVSASGKVRWIVNSWKSSSPRETAGTDRSAAPPGT